MKDRQTDKQTDTLTDNKGRLELSGAREPKDTADVNTSSSLVTRHIQRRQLHM